MGILLWHSHCSSYINVALVQRVSTVEEVTLTHVLLLVDV